MMLPDIRTIYSRLKSSAKSRNIQFDLTLTELYTLDYPLTCPILGIPLKCHRGGPKDDSYSVDRIDSSLGYTIDNIHIISFRANRIKNDATNQEITKIHQFLNT
jgi:hypothetical protein